MTALGWLWLAASVLVLPGVAPSRARVRALVERDRLTKRARPVTSNRQRVAVAPRAVSGAWCLGAAAAVTIARGTVLGVTAGIAAATVAVLVQATVRRRAMHLRERHLHNAVAILVAELDAGSRPGAALAAAAEASPEHHADFEAASRAASTGDDASATLLDRPDLIPLGHAWRLADESGAPLAAVLSRVGGDLAASGRQALAASSALAGARSSAGLLALLPALGMCLGAAIGARPVSFLLDTPAGRLLALVGVALDSAGMLWAQCLISRAERA